MKNSLFGMIVLFTFFVLTQGCSEIDHSSPYSEKSERTAKGTSADQESIVSEDSEKGLNESGKPGVNKKDLDASGNKNDELESLLVKKASVELGRSVTVQIKHRERLNNWVYIVGAPRESNGDPLNYGSTNLATQAGEGIVDDMFMALAQQVAGQWEILEFSIGSTDAPFFDWSERYEIPLELFSAEKN